MLRILVGIALGVAVAVLAVRGRAWLSRWLRRPPPASRPAPPAPPAALPPGGDPFELAAALEPFFREAAHPAQLLDLPPFRAAVSALAGARTPAQLVELGAGEQPVVGCLALEALTAAAPSPDVADALLARLNVVRYWPRFFIVRALAHHAGEAPVVGDALTRVDDTWTDENGIATLRGFVRRRLEAGESPRLVPHLDGLPTAQLDRVATLAGAVADLAPDLAAQLRRWREARVDRDFLASFGRVWSDDGAAEPPLPDERVALADETARLLARTPPRSALLVGEPGVGKTTLIALLARRLQRDGWVVFTASAGGVNAGMNYVGQLEERVQQIVRQAQDRRLLWIVPDFHELFWAGQHSRNPVGLLDLLLPHVAGGVLKVVGETHPAAYDLLIRQRPKTAEALEVVRVPPLADDATLELGRRWARQRAAPGAPPPLTEATLLEAWQLARHYLAQRAAPGNLLQLLEAACDLAGSPAGGGHRTVGLDDLLLALSRMTGLPLGILDDRRGLDVRDLRAFFEQRVLGQREAVECLVERVAMLKAGLTDPSRPPGVFLFVGPTGTGKTHIAKTLAEFLFGSADRMVRLDMSEFQTWESLDRLLAEDETGGGVSLVSAVRRQPFSVVLLDEFEKAGRHVWSLFLQVFDDGRLRDRRGNVADFRHCIIIMTSNLGAAVPTGASIGFTPATAAFTPAAVERALAQTFPPELLNRIDRVVVFRPLDRVVMREILRKELADVLRRRGLRTRAWAVEWDESAIEFLLEKGFTADLGARPLKRAVERYVLAPLALAIVGHEAPAGDQFLFVRREGDRIEAVFVDPDAPEPDVAAAARVTREDERPPLEALILDARGVPSEVDFLAEEYRRVADVVRAPAWQRRKQEALARTTAAEFWESPDRFAVLGLAEYLDRIEVAVETAGSLVQRLRGTRGRQDRPRAPRDLVARLAQQVYLLDAACAALAGGRPRDAFLAVIAGEDAGAQDAASDDFAMRIGRMYRRWAAARRMRLEVLEESGGDGATPYRLVVAVSGFAAYAILEPENGLHVLEWPQDERSFQRARARVVVAPQPDRPAAGRSEQRAQAADALAVERAGVPAIVRRYREAPSPLVRDGVRGWRTGRLDRVLDGHFDVIVGREE